MDLHPIGYDRLTEGSGEAFYMETAVMTEELVNIRTNLVEVTIKGAASHPMFPDIAFRDRESALRIACDDPFETFLAGEPETLLIQNIGRACMGQYRISPLFFEQQRYEIIIEPESGHKVEFWHENYNVRKNVTPVGKRGNILTGIINFGNDIGMSDLYILVDGRRYMKLTIEVFPSKISYKDDYKAIVADVTAEVYNLVFDFLRKTYDSFDISSGTQSSPVEFFAIIQKIYNKFIIAADMVISRPHHILEKEYQVLPGHKVRRTDNRSIRWIEKHPDQAVRSGEQILAAKTLAVRKYVTYDTKENRLTKYMLESTAKRLEHFRAQYLKLVRDTDLSVINRIDRMTQGIRRRCNTGFFKEVEAIPAKSGMSLVFNMAPGYRDLYRCYLLLQHGLSVTGSIFNVSVKDLAVLYEYWCFIKLNSLMKDRYEMISQDIIKIAGNGLFVSLIKGQRSRVHYRNPDNGEHIVLSYNPKEISGATVPQRPDNVLRLEKKSLDNKAAYEYVFDAKYRINAAPEGSMYQQMYRTPGPQEGDINTMHRYRDAIVAESGASSYERTMFGAYVLFPYHNEKEYREHRFYKSIDRVNIGGLPFLPSATGMVTDLLDQLIADSPDSAFERATLPRGIEERLAKVDWSRRDVLIGTFRSRKQFEICLKDNFYYIPAHHVKDANLPIHYVAMFQTPRIFSNEAGIHYYGEVLRTVRVKRESIREVPMTHGNPEEIYYRFVIRKWIPLSRPILPKESGFVRAFTNTFLLENVEFVPELLLQSEEEYRFYMELKRRTGQALERDFIGDDKNPMETEDNKSEGSGFEIGGTKVIFDNGGISIIRDGKCLVECKISDFSRRPNSKFREMMGRLRVNSDL